MRARFRGALLQLLFILYIHICVMAKLERFVAITIKLPRACMFTEKFYKLLRSLRISYQQSIKITYLHLWIC